MRNALRCKKNILEIVERETGIEPATTGLGSRCSTIELLPLCWQSISQSPLSPPQSVPTKALTQIEDLESPLAPHHFLSLRSFGSFAPHFRSALDKGTRQGHSVCRPIQGFSFRYVLILLIWIVSPFLGLFSARKEEITLSRRTHDP
jgi:hypothetical protein